MIANTGIFAYENVTHFDIEFSTIFYVQLLDQFRKSRFHCTNELYIEKVTNIITFFLLFIIS